MTWVAMKRMRARRLTFAGRLTGIKITYSIVNFYIFKTSDKLKKNVAAEQVAHATDQSTYLPGTIHHAHQTVVVTFFFFFKKKERNHWLIREKKKPTYTETHWMLPFKLLWPRLYGSIPFWRGMRARSLGAYANNQSIN